MTNDTKKDIVIDFPVKAQSADSAAGNDGDNNNPPSEPPQEETPTQSGIASSRLTQDILGLLERIFNHPRYAGFIIAALLVVFFTNNWVVIAPLTLFFVFEIGLRVWQQQHLGWRNRIEILFIAIDTIATVSLILAIFIQVADVESGLLLRGIRILRGLSMLRTLRVFRMFTDETAVYSHTIPVFSIVISFIAVWLDELVIAAVSLLVLELAYRSYAIFRVLPKGNRRHAETFFIFVDLLATVAITGLWGLPVELLILRLFRFLIMLNPLGTAFGAIKKVLGNPELRQEISMLVGGFFLLQAVTLFIIVYFYPPMDLNEDGIISASDQSPFQILLYVFMLLLDPGSAPKNAFGPWFLIPTAGIVLAGIFLFALIVGLGSNLMALLLKELSNSPLSARVQLLFCGWNQNAEAIMASFDRLSNRMRRSFPSVWLFYGALKMVHVGRWASLRTAQFGARRVLQNFKLFGLRQTIIFTSSANKDLLSEEHSILKEFALLQPEATPLIITDDTPEQHIHDIYRHEMAGEIIASAELSARMLYQMHHSPFMAELGIHFLDTVGHENGLHAVSFDAIISPAADGADIHGLEESIKLNAWLHTHFIHGINVLAMRTDKGEYLLVGDLLNTREPIQIKDFLGIGRDYKTWADKKVHPGVLPPTGQLLPFTWPDTWEFNMIFMGWHAGLPAMLLEMSKKHHKLGLHVLIPGDEKKREQALNALLTATQKQDDCIFDVQVHPWDGLTTSALQPFLKGCKVIILYPEDNAESNEDSLLELWFHLTARSLSIQKERMKWWTPPKLMLLPRDLSDIATFNRATLDYPLLNIDCGSPDAFHNTYIAKRLLSEVLRDREPKQYEQERKCFELVDLLLSDAIIVEDIEPTQLVDPEKNIDWDTFYMNALDRGWSPVAFIPPVYNRPLWIDSIEGLFPSDTDIAGSGLQLLGARTMSDLLPVSNTARILLCRRGVLSDFAEIEKEDASEQVEEPKSEQKQTLLSPDPATDTETAVANVAEVKENPDEVQDLAHVEQTKEGEIMTETVWPKHADQRLIRVMKSQIEGSLELLHQSTDDGLVKLMDAMDQSPSPEIEADILAALTDLQNIDRVMQRITNVMTCLEDWGNAAEPSSGKPIWEEEVSQRYVMEEERQTLRKEI